MLRRRVFPSHRHAQSLAARSYGTTPRFYRSFDSDGADKPSDSAISDAFRFTPAMKRSVPPATLSATASKVHERLQMRREHPAAILRELVASNESHPIDALLLPMRQLALNLSRRPTRGYREEMLREPIAATLLQYIWSHEDLWRTFALDAHDEIVLLARYADVEGLTRFMIDWLHVEVSWRNSEPGLAQRWRGYILCSIIKAHLLNEVHNSADRALKLLFEVNQAKLDQKSRYAKWLDSGRLGIAPPDTLTFLSIKPAVIELTRALTRKKFHGTSVDLYDRFMTLRSIFEDVKPLDFDQAQLALMHPTRPNTRLALEFVEKGFSWQDPQQSKWTQEATMPMREMLHKFFIHLSAQLRAEGRCAEEGRVIEKYRTLTGEALGLKIHRFEFK